MSATCAQISFLHPKLEFSVSGVVYENCTHAAEPVDLLELTCKVTIDLIQFPQS